MAVSGQIVLAANTIEPSDKGRLLAQLLAATSDDQDGYPIPYLRRSDTVATRASSYQMHSGPAPISGHWRSLDRDTASPGRDAPASALPKLTMRVRFPSPARWAPTLVGPLPRR
jgi:hypothetical protein